MNAKTKTMQDVKRAFFGVANLAAGQVAAQEAADLVSKENGKIVFNFDAEKGLPEGYGLAIIPIAKKDEAKQERVTTGVCIAAIPELSSLNTTAEGADFVRLALADVLIAKIANAVRPRADGSTANVIPFSVADFITSNRPEGILAGFNAVAPAFVAVLKTKGLSLMTKELLRQILSCTAFAKAQHPKIPQSSWVAILQGMIKSASDKGLTVAALEQWIESRDTAGMPQAEDVDLSDLDYTTIG